MNYKIARHIIAMMLVSTSGCLIASSPIEYETCVGAPWKVCWGTPVYTVNVSNTISVKSTNGQTYNNIQFSWTPVGSDPAPTVVSMQNCLTSMNTGVSGCTVYPDSTGVFTGVDLLGVTAGQYLIVTVIRKNSDGSSVNLFQTRIGPLLVPIG